MKTCQRCDGDRLITVTLKDRNNSCHGCGIQHIIGCPMCDGKGYTDESDRKRYMRSMGIPVSFLNGDLC